MYGVWSTGFSDGEAESAEQDQTAHMCSLILLHTLRKMNSMVANGSMGIDGPKVILFFFIYFIYFIYLLLFFFFLLKNSHNNNNNNNNNNCEKRRQNC